jgi:hypothetical protein
MELQEVKVYNYCLAFVDLLGQRAEFKSEGLIPDFKSNEDEELFHKKIQNTIGRIYKLQNDAEMIMDGVESHNPDIKDTLTQEEYDLHTKLTTTRIKRQRWSDGLVFFTSLGDSDVKCPALSLFKLFGLVGSLCFSGLVRRQPIRGAIDIAWGIELHENELYGAAVAKAYELESRVAQYPRIVVGENVISYLKYLTESHDNNIYSKSNHQFADDCLSMVKEDVDGYFFLHYLGDFFNKYVFQERHVAMYKEALNFIREQYDIYRKLIGNNESNKLAFRYSHLLSYFMTHPI